LVLRSPGDASIVINRKRIVINRKRCAGGRFSSFSTSDIASSRQRCEAEGFFVPEAARQKCPQKILRLCRNIVEAKKRGSSVPFHVFANPTMFALKAHCPGKHFFVGIRREVIPDELQTLELTSTTLSQFLLRANQLGWLSIIPAISQCDKPV
jgi:hypothetical protein